VELLIAALVAAIAIAVFRLMAQRAVTIVEDGAVRVVRGGIPAAVLNDIHDVVRDPPVRAARVRIVRAARHALVEIDGEITAHQVQRIRNVIGNVPPARLASGRRA
jgi:hypothetical protein